MATCAPRLSFFKGVIYIQILVLDDLSETDNITIGKYCKTVILKVGDIAPLWALGVFRRDGSRPRENYGRLSIL